MTDIVLKEFTDSLSISKIAPHWNALHKLIPSIPFWIAGGSITSLLNDEPINDWDIFSSDPDGVITDLKNAGATVEFVNSHVTNFKHESITEVIQVVKNKFDTIEDTVSSIDLTINAIGYNGSSLFLHEDFVDDLESMTIGLSNIINPYSTLRRLIKYSRRGYNLHCDVLEHIVQMILDNPPKDKDNLPFYLEQTL